MAKTSILAVPQEVTVGAVDHTPPWGSQCTESGPQARSKECHLLYMAKSRPGARTFTQSGPRVIAATPCSNIATAPGKVCKVCVCGFQLEGDVADRFLYFQNIP